MALPGARFVKEVKILGNPISSTTSIIEKIKKNVDKNV
jgi:hypothetical protein